MALPKVHTAAVLVVTALVLAALAAPSERTASAAADFNALTAPQRLLDTRPGAPTADGQSSGVGVRPADSTLELPVAGRAEIPPDAATVVLNVTVDAAAQDGFITVFPCGTDRPNASNLQYATGQTIANLVVAKVGAAGTVCFYSFGATHLVVDVSGYLPADAFSPLSAPQRLLDSRPGASTVDGQFAGIGVRPAGSTTELPVAGRAGIPPEASSVVLNVTVDAPAQAGFVTVHPCGAERPNASTLNYAAGQRISDATVSAVSTGGAVCFYTFGTTHLVVDVTGAFPAGGFHALPTPQRLVDSRQGAATADGRFAGIGVRPGQGTLQLPVAGRAGVPADASAVVLNVTVDGALDGGFVTAHPTGSDRPTASNLNYAAGQTIANAVVARVGVGGNICLHTYGATHLIVDVVGWLPGPPPPATGAGCPAQALFPYWRMVALFGTDRAAALGALGEQPPEAAAARLDQVAEPWRSGDRPVLGTFELIATVASSAPGPEGLYRSPSDPAHVQRYLDAARAHGLYLLLDIQPGRSDFLTEVRRYEPFLRQPDVGVALDPEWRVGPDEVPGRVVGQVSAAEVNEVSAYLAGLVAEQGLPQKLLVIHQFQLRMLPDRENVVARDGLAVMIHMDGFGTRQQKLDTYAAVHAGPPFYNGFKLFYDEDINMFSPGEVLALNPVPDLVTYQ